MGFFNGSNMAKFLNTSATTYHLEELIKNATERLILISPYLKLNDKVRELLADKDRMKLDIRIVYGKSDLPPSEIKWLQSLSFVRCSFCKHLHAKCYMNESEAIITSMNLYDFSQVNNNEMGVLIDRATDPDLFATTQTEALRLVRVSEEVVLSVEVVKDSDNTTSPTKEKPATKMVSTTQLAKAHSMTAKELFSKFLDAGLVARVNDSWQLTEKGKEKGGTIRNSKQFGEYIVWPSSLNLRRQ